jgi:hypothetical protein
MTPAADHLRRDMLIAVELIDPVTRLPVFRGVQLDAAGMAHAPLIGWSGRFVWLAEGERWPQHFAFNPGTAPYEAETFAAPPPPVPPAQLPADQRLQRFTLHPTVAYPFGDDLTVVRGQLRETADPGAAPIPRARVWLRWTDQTGLPKQVDAQHASRTDSQGSFAAFLRLPAGARPALNKGLVVAHIMAERGGQTRMTAQDVPDGRLLDLRSALAWSAMTNV